MIKTSLWKMPIRTVFLNRDFSGDRLVHQFSHNTIVAIQALEMHQLGEGRLYGAVISAYNSRILELKAGVVAFHLYLSGHTLTDIDDHNTPFGGLLQQFHEPRMLRSIAASVASHHDATQFGRLNQVSSNVLLNAGEERKNGDIGVECLMGLHRTTEVGAKNLVRMEVEIYAGIAQGRIVEGFEGIESVGILLSSTISTQQFSTEIDAHLGYKRRAIGVVRGSKIDAGDEVFFAVGNRAERGLPSVLNWPSGN